MPTPHVSVIVPVRDRRDLLGDLLDGLAAQTYRDFDLIVVDDGSTDGSAELAEAETRFPVQVIRQRGAGAVAARTNGVALSTGTILAFTDSDCVPQPQWLAAGVAAIEAGHDVVAGHTHAARKRYLLERSLHVEDDGLYPTCNVFYLRRAYMAAGGFDAELSGEVGFNVSRRARDLGVGEDTLLGWRVRRLGRAAYVPTAIVAHAVFPPDMRDHFSRTLQVGAFPRLVKLVPELRQTLLRGRVFLGLTRIPLYLAIVLAAVGLPLPALVASGLFVGWHFGRVLRGNGSLVRKLVAWPVVVATDLLTAVVLLLGSVRAGSLVL